MKMLELINLLNTFDNLNNFLNLRFLNYFKWREGVIRRRKIRREYRIRRRINPLTEYNNLHFKKRFRFSKEEVKYIYELVDGQETLQPMVCK